LVQTGLFSSCPPGYTEGSSINIPCGPNDSQLVTCKKCIQNT
jgi:hypothetical protein